MYLVNFPFFNGFCFRNGAAEVFRKVGRLTKHKRGAIKTNRARSRKIQGCCLEIPAFLPKSCRQRTWAKRPGNKRQARRYQNQTGAKSENPRPLLPNPGVSPQTHLPSLSLPSLFGRRKGRKVIGSEGNDKDNKFKVLQSVPCFHFSCLSFIGNKFIILVTYGPFSSRNHSQFVPHPRNHFQASSLPHVARLLSAGGGGHTGRGEEVWRVEEE